MPPATVHLLPFRHVISIRPSDLTRGIYFLSTWIPLLLRIQTSNDFTLLWISSFIDKFFFFVGVVSTKKLGEIRNKYVEIYESLLIDRKLPKFIKIIQTSNVTLDLAHTAMHTTNW